MAPIDVPPEFRWLLDRMADEQGSALDRMFAAATLRDGLDELLAELAQAAREEEGYSWADVGAVLNITKQAAQQRLGRQHVLTVGPDGNVTTTESRDEYVAALRAALDHLESTGDEEMHRLVADALDQAEHEGAGGADHVVPIRVEVEVEVPVPVPPRAASKGRKGR